MNMRPLVELGWDYRGSSGKKKILLKVPKLSVKDDISEVLVSRTGNGSDWNDGIIHINTLEWQKSYGHSTVTVLSPSSLIHSGLFLLCFHHRSSSRNTRQHQTLSIHPGKTRQTPADWLWVSVCRCGGPILNLGPNQLWSGGAIKESKAWRQFSSHYCDRVAPAQRFWSAAGAAPAIGVFESPWLL